MPPAAMTVPMAVLVSDTSTQTAAKIRSVFRQVWNEYYAWEAVLASKALASIHTEQKKDQDRQSFFRMGEHLPLVSRDSNLHKSVDGSKTRETEAFTALEFGDQSATLEDTVVDVEVLSLKDFEPCPSYEACTPIPANVLQGDDSSDMPFIPLADDPTFDATDHCLDYDNFAWQVTHVDSDLNAIILETALRLHYKHGISIAHIDEANVLPRRLKTCSGVWGVIWLSTQNDIIDWPGSSRADYPPLFDSDFPVPDAIDLRTRLQDHLTLVCPNLSCTHASCLSHDPRPVTVGPLDERFTPDHLKEGEHTRKEAPPCGPSCCFLQPDSALEQTLSLTPSERAEIRVVLQLASTASSCELAMLCRRPCLEIPAIRKALALTPLDSSAPSTRAYDDAAAPKFEESNASQFTPNHPCDHAGPCTAQIQCACVLTKAHCTRNCRCSRQCNRRWAGCRCGHNPARARERRSCLIATCPCRRAGRECDPELCAPCFDSVREQRPGRVQVVFPLKGSRPNTCRNCQIQLGCRKALEVRRSEFGMGVFLAEAAREGDLIAEYTGELIYEATFDTRGDLAKHRGRDYVYNLNESFSVDGTYAGNETASSIMRRRRKRAVEWLYSW
ncbi:uncharacterized protein B0H18DRAFT_1208615 [Fomitopsis serialis]|uniref:uncharacterized protein n=1 Tax=Fomitopsis serialis TaxID=139415 RepID=UPI00200746AD|nr:uncharacterized protein B0H18DRAFT_1208615 [Neoantrodia serialis]KAH9932330.1 hypothetical protein B0H18DRAFT_1208615 [Neoantrodia serialis]